MIIELKYLGDFQHRTGFEGARTRRELCQFIKPLTNQLLAIDERGFFPVEIF
jgi:hypothetical protein